MVSTIWVIALLRGCWTDDGETKTCPTCWLQNSATDAGGRVICCRLSDSILGYCLLRLERLPAQLPHCQAAEWHGLDFRCHFSFFLCDHAGATRAQTDASSAVWASRDLSYVTLQSTCRLSHVLGQRGSVGPRPGRRSSRNPNGLHHSHSDSQSTISNSTGGGP